MSSLPFTNLARPLDRFGDEALPLMSRLVFAGVLLVYYWNSGLTKLGDGLFGLFNPSLGAYAQIFHKPVECAEL